MGPKVFRLVWSFHFETGKKEGPRNGEEGLGSGVVAPKHVSHTQLHVKTWNPGLHVKILNLGRGNMHLHYSSKPVESAHSLPV